MTGRYLHTVWCDDIRHEVGNKPSLMGVYTGHIVVPQLPMHLAKLGVFSTLSSPLNKPFETPLKIEIKRDDGHVLVTIEAEAPSSATPVEEGEASRIQVGTGFGLGPVELPIGCKYIVVEATADGEVVTGPKLWVKVDPDYFAQVMQPMIPAAPAGR